MLSALVEQTGVPHRVAQVVEQPLPEPGPGEVRLRMVFAPINPADLNFIEGTYGRKPDLPSPLGIEGCGVIDARGPGVTLPVGRLAIPLSGIGCWAEAIVRPAAAVFVLPEVIDPVQAAMLRVNPATAWGLLHAAGPLAPGSWVVQNAASSAAGHCVIAVARHLGLRTLSLVRRPESADACRAAGADAVLVDGTDAADAARAIPDFRPAALALNAVGGDSALRLLNLLGPGGTMVTYGAMGRQPLKVPNGLLIFKDLRLVGFWLTRWLESAPAADVSALYQRLADLVLSGAIRQPVAAIHSLTNLPLALEQAAASGRNGKILLKLAGDS